MRTERIVTVRSISFFHLDVSFIFRFKRTDDPKWRLREQMRFGPQACLARIPLPDLAVPTRMRLANPNRFSGSVRERVACWGASFPSEE